MSTRVNGQALLCCLFDRTPMLFSSPGGGCPRVSCTHDAVNALVLPCISIAYRATTPKQVHSWSGHSPSVGRSWETATIARSTPRPAWSAFENTLVTKRHSSSRGALKHLRNKVDCARVMQCSVCCEGLSSQDPALGWRALVDRAGHAFLVELYENKLFLCF